MNPKPSRIKPKQNQDHDSFSPNWKDCNDSNSWMMTTLQKSCHGFVPSPTLMLLQNKRMKRSLEEPTEIIRIDCYC